MTKLIQFHGELERLYPEGIRVEGGSAYECISALQNFPHFNPEEDQMISVVLPDFQSRDAIYDLTDKEVIHVHPFLAGAGGKTGALLQIVVGVVLIATGWGAAAGTGILGSSITTGMLTGALMVLGGVTQLLMPQPKLDSSTTEDNKSNYLSANKNTVKIGTRIPLIFGRRKWYGHILSFNVSATSVALPPAAQAVSEGVPNTLVIAADGIEFPIFEGGV